jgi:AhpD family alkylhydroperoxidase
LPRAERELAATVASKINGCIYCASVHARKAAQLAKDETAVDTLLAVTPGKIERRPVAALAGGNRCRRRAVGDAARAESQPSGWLDEQGWIPWPSWICCSRRPFSPGPTG